MPTRPKRRLVECVPNFSEGRDAAKVDRIAEAARMPGVALLDRSMDSDHNRAVITLAGEPEALLAGVLASIGEAVALIDLRSHVGVHPRIGAADVVPFVPVEGVTMEDCARLAHRMGGEIWKHFGVPVYFYGAAAQCPERQRLERVRHGQFETLVTASITDPARSPDVGGPALHPTAGAAAVGARKFLIAYNVNLASRDLEIARSIARAIRESNGGLPCVKAMGVPLLSRGLVQVSMNLTDFERTPIHQAFERVHVLADAAGVGVVGSEIIGLVPRRALETSAGFDLQWENFTSASVLENRIEQVLGA